VDFGRITSESVECINLAVDMNERNCVLASLGLSSVDLRVFTWNNRTQWHTLVLKVLNCCAVLPVLIKRTVRSS
jgi:hypothetical protein